MINQINRPFQLIVISGNGVSREGIIPPHVVDYSQVAAQIYHTQFERYGSHPLLVPTGKWAISYDKDHRLRGLALPTQTEAMGIAKVLYSEGVAECDVFPEQRSQDTPGNAWAVRDDVVIKRDIQNALVVCPKYFAFRAERFFKYFLGDSFDLSILPVTPERGNDPETTDSQRRLLDRQIAFLNGIDTTKPFDPERLYSLDFYTGELDDAAKIGMGIEAGDMGRGRRK